MGEKAQLWNRCQLFFAPLLAVAKAGRLELNIKTPLKNLDTQGKILLQTDVRRFPDLRKWGEVKSLFPTSIKPSPGNFISSPWPCKSIDPTKGRPSAQKWMFFWKSSEGRGGGHFRSKKLHCRFCWFQSGIFWRKKAQCNFQKGGERGGSSPIQKISLQIYAYLTDFLEKGAM